MVLGLAWNRKYILKQKFAPWKFSWNVQILFQQTLFSISIKLEKNKIIFLLITGLLTNAQTIHQLKLKIIDHFIFLNHAN